MRIIEARLMSGTFPLAEASGDSLRRALSQLCDDKAMHGKAAERYPATLTVEFATREWSEADEE